MGVKQTQVQTLSTDDTKHKRKLQDQAVLTKQAEMESQYDMEMAGLNDKAIQSTWKCYLGTAEGLGTLL